MAGPLWRFGRGERAKRRGLPEMSRGLLTPPRAAPFRVRQLEVQVRRNHLGTLRDTSLSRKHRAAPAFADQSRIQCLSLTAARPVSCPPGSAREWGIEPQTLTACASTSSRHRCVCPTQRRPRSRDRQNLHSDFARICRPRLFAPPTLGYIGCRCTGLERDQSSVSRHVPYCRRHLRAHLGCEMRAAFDGLRDALGLS
jgi:hypothetical protein